VELRYIKKIGIRHTIHSRIWIVEPMGIASFAMLLKMEELGIKIILSPPACMPGIATSQISDGKMKWIIVTDKDTYLVDLLNRLQNLSREI
jgi:hypothetical protein